MKTDAPGGSESSPDRQTQALFNSMAEGVLILDNSEREDAAAACTLLTGASWTARHFTGPGPHSFWPVFWRTTAFFRVPTEKA